MISAGPLVTFINKLKRLKTEYILIIITFFIANFQQTELVTNNNYLKLPVIVIMSLLFSYFIKERIKKNIKCSFDEIIAISISIIGLISGFFILTPIHHLNILKPVLFSLSYIGISSFVKTYEIDSSKILFFLKLILFLSFIHYIYAVIVSFDSIILFVSNKLTFDSYRAMAWKGLYLNYNRFGWTLLIGFISSCVLSFYNYFEIKKVKTSLFYAFISLAFFSGIIMSSSRSSLWGILVFTLCMMIVGIKKIFKENNYTDKRFWVYTVIGVVFIYLLFWFYFDIFEFIIKKTMLVGTSVRTKLWKVFIITQWANFPDIRFFLGHGYRLKIDPLFRSYGHVHNNYLFVWGQYGLIGMLLFITKYIHLLKTNLKKFNKYWYIWFIPISILFMIFFESILVRKNLKIEVLFLYLFILIPYNDALREKKKSKKE